jgi:hypothetical protein
MDRQVIGHPVSDILDKLECAGGGSGGGDGTVTVGEIVERMGPRSFLPLLLIPALLMVSPLSSIPGTPTLSALIIGLIAAQMLLGRQRLWLPAFVRRRSFKRARLERAIGFLRRPVGWIEPMMRPRLAVLAEGPGAYIALLVCLLVTAIMPVMEFLPILASVAAVAITLIATGLLARDGVLVLSGYGVVLLAIVIARTLVVGVQEL